MFQVLRSIRVEPPVRAKSEHHEGAVGGGADSGGKRDEISDIGDGQSARGSGHSFRPLRAQHLLTFQS